MSCDGAIGGIICGDAAGCAYTREVRDFHAIKVLLEASLSAIAL